MLQGARTEPGLVHNLEASCDPTSDLEVGKCDLGMVTRIFVALAPGMIRDIRHIRWKDLNNQHEGHETRVCWEDLADNSGFAPENLAHNLETPEAAAAAQKVRAGFEETDPGMDDHKAQG